MNGKQGFPSTSSRQNIDLPTNDGTLPDVYLSEGDSAEEGTTNLNSDLISVEARINKYKSQSRDTFPGESCELVDYSVVDLTAEESENEETTVASLKYARNDKENDVFSSSPSRTVQSIKHEKDIVVPRRNDTSEAPGEETFEEENDRSGKLENTSLQDRQEQDISPNPGPSHVKSLMPQMNRQAVEEIENSTDGGNEETKKKKVSWQVGETKPKKITKKAAASAVFKGSLASTVTTIAGLKRWKLKAKQDTQSDFEKYPGHLRVVQEHLRQEKTETPLTIRQDVKKEVLPILANIVKAYKKELVGEHRLLREATFKYERLKSELQDAFL